jgi:AcrR family transcriptional regulator
MTKHQSKEDRIQEILMAAALEIDEKGYPSLTMDAVVERTSLSKGGVYRYFPGKHDLTMALFEKACTSEADFEMDEVIALDKPAQQILHDLLVRDHEDEEALLWQRVWLQLLPQAIFNPEVRALRLKLEEYYIEKYGILIGRLIERDNIKVVADFEKRLPTVMKIGATLLEGVSYRLLSGLSNTEEKKVIQQFIEVMFDDLLDKTDD